MATDYWAGPIGEFLQQVVTVAQVPICFAGDGAVSYWGTIDEIVGNGAKRPISNSIYLRASSIALLGRERLLAGERHDPLTLAPLYLRLAEAERKLRAKHSTCR